MDQTSEDEMIDEQSEIEKQVALQAQKDKDAEIQVVKDLKELFGTELGKRVLDWIRLQSCYDKVDLMVFDNLGQIEIGQTSKLLGRRELYQLIVSQMKRDLPSEEDRQTEQIV